MANHRLEQKIANSTHVAIVKQMKMVIIQPILAS